MSAAQFKATMEPKLLAKRAITPAGCWLWMGAISTYGYGITNFERKQIRAHQAAYRVWKGEVPTGMQIDHLCRNRSCFNPEHLECVTPRENTLRGEGPSAQAARRDHCAAGHEYTAANMYISARGARVCRQCHVDSQHRYVAKTTSQGAAA